MRVCTSQLRLHFLSHCEASICTTHLWLYVLPRCEALLLIFQGDGIEWGPHPYLGYSETHPYQYPPSARGNTSPVTPPLSHPRGSASKGPGSLEQPPPPIRPSRVPEPAISLLGGERCRHHTPRDEPPPYNALVEHGAHLPMTKAPPDGLVGASQAKPSIMPRRLGCCRGRRRVASGRVLGHPLRPGGPSSSFVAPVRVVGFPPTPATSPSPVFGLPPSLRCLLSPLPDSL